jgi:formylglycine-generating enzyme required for sulfatase activity
VTCVPWTTAAAFCESRGDRLPTEAELEFVMGGRRSRARPWGDDEPGCGDAVLARMDPRPLQSQEIAKFECASLGIGASPRGSAPRDVLSLSTGQIFDLLGNVAEWAADDGQPFGGSCWTNGLVIDPRCELTVRTDRRVHRGRSFADVRAEASARGRILTDSSRAVSNVGFRCARAGK